MLKKFRIKNPFLSPSKRANMLKNDLGRIGDRCQVFDKVSFGSEPYLIKIGNDVKITYGCQFITHDGGMHVLRVNGKAPNSHVYGPINIGNNVFLGNKVIIMPGITIGDNCIIGAGSIVTKSIESNSVAAGIPARIITTIDKYCLDKEKYIHNTENMSFEDKKKYLLNKLLNKPESFLKR